MKKFLLHTLYIFLLTMGLLFAIGVFVAICVLIPNPIWIFISAVLYVIILVSVITYRK